MKLSLYTRTTKYIVLNFISNIKISIFPILCLLYIVPFQLKAQHPNWIEVHERVSNYPKKIYYTGFVTRYFDTNEDTLQIKNELLKNVRIRLSKAVDTTLHYEVFTTKELNLSGMQTRTYFDKTHALAYAFAYVKKREVQKTYYFEFISLMNAIEQELNTYKNKVIFSRDYGHLLILKEKLRRAGYYQDVLISLNITNSFALRTIEWDTYWSNVNKMLDKVREAPYVDIDLGAVFLRDELFQQVAKDSISAINLELVSYKGTNLFSDFSLYVHDHLFKKFKQVFTIIEESTEMRIDGAYWPIGNDIRLTLSLHKVVDGEVLKLAASASIVLEASQFEKLNIHINPFESLTSKKQYESIVQEYSYQGLLAYISTNKGNHSLIFREGELLKISIGVSRPSFVSLINILPDGNQLLLLDNHYVGSKSVNKLIEQPFEWETSCPCGNEYLILLASSFPFPILETKQQDGFNFLTESAVDFIDAQKNIAIANSSSSHYFTETVLSLTTTVK